MIIEIIPSACGKPLKGNLSTYLKSAIIPNAINTSPSQFPYTIVINPTKIRPNLKISFVDFLKLFLRKIKAAKGGIINKAITSEAVRAAVFVNASGLNNLPSAPMSVKTGIKLIIVVKTAVTIAPETSEVAL